MGTCAAKATFLYNVRRILHITMLRCGAGYVAIAATYASMAFVKIGTAGSAPPSPLPLRLYLTTHCATFIPCARMIAPPTLSAILTTSASPWPQ
jgi:hypothetical protein